MSVKTNADVIIGGKVYTLSGYESEAYLQKVAAYINNKISEFDELEDYRRFPAEMKATLLELNLADEYFKAKTQAEKLEEDLEIKSKALYNLQHELVSTQIKMDTLEKSLEQLEKENKELLLNKTKLETALEDALLGKVEPLKKAAPADSQGAGREALSGKAETAGNDRHGKPDSRKKDIQPWKVETIKRDGSSSGKKEPKKKDVQTWKAEQIGKEETPREEEAAGKAASPEKAEAAGKAASPEKAEAAGKAAAPEKAQTEKK